MSLFMGNSSQYSVMDVNPERMKMAEVQYNAMAETFTKLLHTCERKCLGHKYGEGELNTGEASCIDRCVSKYVRVNYLVGTDLQQKGFNPFSSMSEYKYIKEKLNL
ncbi:subunit of the TIM22-complex [Hyphopichia burtonii NRRL Y-1933]|uniref:Mitochondrial import inner membrane translocase subunit n=1 Tax=Hyphopichia burtonii NRRL Y-1933 TaxID=984485 RepID=A0A1E4RG89_9ASCO|nr:subunit of the TIM22-complex [Hyphopichia burtonii NRRL Y-1933]ODV66279.1 subunit of the TIM22-complex [Hyphopichia burtonii NRRL Y-1933]